MSDENEVSGIVEAALFGAPVLPSECAFTEQELAERIARNEPIINAAEYLARVKLEAKSLPAIISAVIVEQTGTLTASSTERGSKKRRKETSGPWGLPEKIPKLTDSELSPSKREALNHAFVTARDSLSDWESQFVQDESKRDKLKKVVFPSTAERIQWMEFYRSTPPLLHVVLQIDNVAAVRGIKHFTRALELGEVLDHPKASWLFSLLARLDVPYTDDVAWTLKKLLRLCASVVIETPVGDDSEIHPVLLVRCLLEDVFRQGD